MFALITVYRLFPHEYPAVWEYINSSGAEDDRKQEQQEKYEGNPKLTLIGNPLDSTLSKCIPTYFTEFRHIHGNNK